MRKVRCIAVLLCSAGLLSAQNWLGGSGDWNDPNNWSQGPCFILPCSPSTPDPAHGIAGFSGPGSGTVNITSDVTGVGAINVTGGNYTFDLNGGALGATGIVFQFTPPVGTPTNTVTGGGVLNIQNGTLNLANPDYPIQQLTNIDNGALKVGGGGALTAGYLRVGADADTSGSLTLTGATAQGTLGGFEIGTHGAGTLTLSSGAQLNSGLGQQTFVGAYSDSSGTINISGTGTQWNVGGELILGDAGAASLDMAGGAATINGNLDVAETGTANLNISNGTLTSQQNAFVGGTAGGTGTASVNGAFGSWTVGSNLTIGGAGTGSLAVTAGAVTVSGNTQIGSNTGGSGTLTVNGADTILSTAGNMVLGNAGTGTLNLTEGTIDTVGNTFIGGSAGGTGMAKVDGPYATWNMTGDLNVGASGIGELNLGNGIVDVVGNAIIGASTGSAGTLTLADPGELNVTGDLIVGQSGNGTMTIAGGTVSVSGSVFAGANTDGAGQLSLTSNDAFLSIAGDLTIAGHGAGTLTNTGGHISVDGNVYIGGDAEGVGTLNQSGTTATLVVGGDLNVGSTGEGTLDLSGGSVTVQNTTYAGGSGTGEIDVSGGGALQTHDLVLGLNHDSSGTLALSGNGSGVTVTGTLEVGHDGTGTVSIDGTTLQTSNAYLGANTSGIGGITIMNGGTLNIDDFVEIGAEGEGTLNITSGTVKSGAAYIGAFASGIGTATISGAGSSWTTSDVLIVGDQGTGTLSINNGGTVTAPTLILGNSSGGQGTVTVDGLNSTLHVSDAVTVGMDGTGTLSIEHAATLFAGSITVNSGSTLQFRDATDTVISTGGAIQLNGGSELKFQGDAPAVSFILAGGAIQMADAPGIHIDGGTGTENLINAAGHTIGGSGAIGNLALFENRGTLSATGSLPLVLDLTGDHAFTNSGIVSISDGSSLRILASAGSTITDNGTIELNSGPGLSSLVLNDLGNHLTLTLGGTGSITMGTGLGNSIRGQFGDENLVNGAAHTIQGSGMITNLNSFTNNGTILVTDENQMQLSFAGSDAFTNNGTLQLLVDGKMKIQNGGLTNAGNIQIGGGPQFGNSELDTFGALVNSGQINVLSGGFANFLGGSVTNSGTITVTDLGQFGSGKLTNSGTLKFDNGQGLTADVINSGTLTIQPGAVSNLSTKKFSNTGTVMIGYRASDDEFGELEATTYNQFEGFTLVQGKLAVQDFEFGHAPEDYTMSGGTTEVEANGVLAFGGTYTQTGGSTKVYGLLSGPTINLLGGTLGGSGKLKADVINRSATVGPGDPVTLTIDGNYTQMIDGILLLNIASMDDFDRLFVTGDVSLDGELELVFMDGFTPTDGSQFSFLSYGGTLSGAFRSIEVVNLPNDLFTVAPDSTGTFTLVTHAVLTPEPSTFLTLFGGLIACAAAFRLRRRQHD